MEIYLYNGDQTDMNKITRDDIQRIKVEKILENTEITRKVIKY